MYNNRKPTLPIDVKYNLVNIEGNESEYSFDSFTVWCRAYNFDLH